MEISNTDISTFLNMVDTFYKKRVKTRTEAKKLKQELNEINKKLTSFAKDHED